MLYFVCSQNWQNIPKDDLLQKDIFLFKNNNNNKLERVRQEKSGLIIVVLRIMKQLVMISNHGSQNIRKLNNRLKTC
jgi:hypothetical protein